MEKVTRNISKRKYFYNSGVRTVDQHARGSLLYYIQAFSYQY